MPYFGYLMVEGQHDVAFVHRLLRRWGFSSVRLYAGLDPFWKKLVPENFPYKDDLLRRVPIPQFFVSNSHSIAVHANEGDRAFNRTLQETLAVLPTQLSSIGVILDADNKGTPDERFKSLCTDLSKLKIEMPVRVGEVLPGTPATGAYILPDNVKPGTLEDLLLACAELQYPQLLRNATTHVSGIDVNQLNADDLKELEKPAGRNKAIVSSISAILKPGKAIQVSIQDNRWLEESSMQVAAVANASSFLQRLFSLPVLG